MNHIFIFGSNSLAVLIHQYLKEEGVKVEGFCLNKEYIRPFDLPLKCYPIEDLIDKYGASNISVYVTLAYLNMNKPRQSVFEMLQSKGVEILNYIHPSAIVDQSVQMGKGNILMENVVIQPFVKMGDGNIFWNCSTISHHSQLGDFNYFAASVTIAGKTTIKNRSFWGCNSTSSNDIVVEDDVLVGAGAFLYKNSPAGSVFVPNRGLFLDMTSDQVKLK